MKLQTRYPAVLGTAVVAGVFSLIVGLLLTIDFVSRGSFELFDSPTYVTLKDQLKENPGDLEIQAAIRQLDLRLRASYFSHRRFMVRGVYLLIGGLVLSLVTARWAASLRPHLPQPVARDDEVDPLTHEQQWGRRGAVALVATVLILMCGFALRADRILPASVDALVTNQEDTQRNANATDTASVAENTEPHPTADAPTAAGKASENLAQQLPTEAEYAAQWPRFRGPTGSGTTTLTDLPQQWNGTDGDGILWKVEVPLPGPNSPVVWKDRLFLSGATPQQQAVFCFDTKAGELLWQLDLPLELGDVKEFEVAEYTGYAAATMATDGVRAYAIFASGNLLATNFQGQLLWRKNLGVPKNTYGLASSLATYKDLVIIQFDQGTAKDDASKLLALHGATGDTAWEVTRPVPSSWASPIVVKQDDQSMVITCVEPWVIAYAAEDGKELWRAECLSGEVGPSPVFANGIVYAANEACGMFAIRADGQGDVTETHVEWFTDIDVPDVCSPVVTDKYLILQAHGLLASFELGKADDPEESREPLWEEELEEEVSSSPSRAGELLYLFAEEGKAWIMKPTAEACLRVAELDMGEKVRSSPAFQPGRIYIRGEEHLFCIGK